MLLRPQGKLAFAELRDTSGSVQLFALAAVTRALRGVRPAQPGRLGRGRGRGGADPAGRALGQGGRVGAAGRGPAQLRRQVARREPTSRRATASARSTCGPTSAAAQLLQLRSDVVRRMRERLWAQGFVEVETPMLHPIAGGRHGPAVRHPPQHARHRLLPARRARALPEAPGGRRLRQGVRDRAHASATRASRRATTPSSRCSSSTRPTPTTRHHGRLRGAGGRRWRWTCCGTTQLTYGGRAARPHPAVAARHHGRAGRRGDRA